MVFGGIENIRYVQMHSTVVRNLIKVWKAETEPSQGDRALSRGLKSALFEILKNRECCHYMNIFSCETLVLLDSEV